jgi:acyl-CoA thioester hydrolase
MVDRPEPLGRDAYAHFTTITMRWSDNDTYGHVNNTIFYQWFDSAVNSLLIGAGLLDIANGDPIGLVVETGCTYFAPLAFPGEVEVGTSVDRLGGSSVTYRLGVFAAGTDQPAAQGHFTHVYVGRQSRRPIPLPDAWRRKLESFR